MNAHNLAHQAYASAAPTQSAQATEFQALAQITRRLKSAADDATRFSDLAAALSDNHRLWTVLAADVAHDQNGLPPSLRARIFYLSEFTDLHTRRVLKGEASIDPLVDINSAIMKGLRGQTEAV